MSRPARRTRGWLALAAVTSLGGCIDWEGLYDAACGDGLPQPPEQCDDGNTDSGDGCSSSCEREAPIVGCGNGQLEPEEACDDGNRNNADSCLNGCSVAACGDGIVRRGVEECDDANAVSTDGCSRNCLLCDGADGEAAYFRSSNAHCYTLHATARTRDEAVAECDERGGYLWTTTSEAEASDVNEALATATRPLWLGLRAGPSPAWPTGESTQYRAWASEEPSSTSVCTVQVASATFAPSWSVAECGEKHAYICETQAAVVFADTRHAYRLFTRPRDWASARAACASKGARLVSIETAEEQAFLARQFSLELWLGGRRVAGESFSWVSGEPVAYSNFARGQPDNNDGNEDCIVLRSNDSWNDASCALARPFVCEFD